jgi:hypothetical protein
MNRSVIFNQKILDLTGGHCGSCPGIFDHIGHENDNFPLITVLFHPPALSVLSFSTSQETSVYDTEKKNRRYHRQKKNRHLHVDAVILFMFMML